MSEARAHAKLSASSAARWMACPPSANMASTMPDIASSYAAEGTLAHSLAELALRKYFVKGIGPKKYDKLRKEIIDNATWEGKPLYQKEMDGYVETYVDYVKSVAIGCNSPFVALEKRVDFGTWVPDGFGTADCIIISGDTMHIIDLKYGKGVPVSAENNPQLQLYALGAYDGYKLLYDIKMIKLTIVQPRLNNISEWSLSLAELFEFGTKAAAAAMIADQGGGEFNPGEHCKFCPGRAVCRARAEYSVQLAGFTKLAPATLANDEIGHYLELGRNVASWLKDLEEYALSQCLAGQEVAGWKAVEGTSRRAWTDQDAAFKAIIGSGVDEAMLYERKPLTLAAVEKMLGKKEFGKFAEYVCKPPGKPTLVVESDKRQAISNAVKAEDVFEKVEE
ncbi:MAG: DUF2800 domain-containing protein [Peptococcaceae bacterium]|nr:DUF2800 domain-containing protein [Peptococcaceae bacterium]